MDHRNKKERKRTREINTQPSSSPPASLLEPDSSLKTRENKAGIFQIYDKFCEKKHGGLHGLMGYESLTKFLENVQCQKKVDCSSGGNKNENYLKIPCSNEFSNCVICVWGTKN